jgi:hypothetical protein
MNFAGAAGGQAVLPGGVGERGSLLHHDRQSFRHHGGRIPRLDPTLTRSLGAAVNGTTMAFRRQPGTYAVRPDLR